MLPEKRKLRKCLELYREPPKAVLSFFRKNDGEAEYAVIGKTFSAEGKSVYALLYYSQERLERASFINRNFDCIDVVPHTPVKWYQTILFTKNEVKTVLLNAGGFYSYFKVSNRNKSPFRYLEHEIYTRKEADSLQRHIEKVKRKNTAYNAEMRPIPKSFFEYARKVQGYGLFDTSDRHNGHCMDCGKDFQTESVLKYKHRHPRHPYLRGNIDRFYRRHGEQAPLGFLECKTTSEFNSGWGCDNIPIHYKIQLATYMSMVPKQLHDSLDTLVIKGFSPVNKIVNLIVKGSWEKSKYGYALVVNDFKEIIPPTKDGIIQQHTGGCYVDEPKTDKSFRTLPLTEQAFELLAEQKTKQSERAKIMGGFYLKSDYVCTWPDGRIILPNYLSKSFHKILKDSDLPMVRLHDLRHSTASNLIDGNMSIVRVSNWLGHSSPTTTLNYYSHVNRKQKEEVAAVIDKMVSVK